MLNFIFKRFCECMEFLCQSFRIGGTQFSSHFWKAFKNGISTKVKHSTTFHPQMDGLAEQTIQTLEDILRACVIDFKGNWDDYLPSIEYAYNNRYHSSTTVALFEALYLRRYGHTKIN